VLYYRLFFEKKGENMHLQKLDLLFEELVEGQKKRMLALAKEIVPDVIEEDLLQPFDFPLLENHPDFRYEEGVLEGLLTARMALLAEIKSSC
jgi:hypothetical protein